jgi:phosphoglycolate phosphatase
MKLVIFDCDGTLVDSQHLIVTAMTSAFIGFDLAPPPRDQILSVVGLSLEGAVARLLPHEGRHRAKALADAYKSAFSDLRMNGPSREPLYPGILETLNMLAERDDVRLAMATGKSRRGVSAILEREGLMSHFSSIQTADDHPSKPHPAMIYEALSETGIEAGRAMMVGDTTFDMEMAIAAGVLPLGVAWGYHPVEDLIQAGAKAVVHESTGLSHTLSSLLKSEFLRHDR